jgi:hypothetical protein
MSADHSAFYSLSTRGLSLEAKRQERETKHPYIIMAWNLIRGQGQIYRYVELQLVGMSYLNCMRKLVWKSQENRQMEILFLGGL